MARRVSWHWRLGVAGVLPNSGRLDLPEVERKRCAGAIQPRRTLQLETGLENDTGRHLDHARVTAVELVEAPKQRIVGNQVVARTGEAP